MPVYSEGIKKNIRPSASEATEGARGGFLCTPVLLITPHAIANTPHAIAFI